MRDVRLDLLAGSLLSFAVGDAIGWPIEGRGNRVGGTKDLNPELVFHSWQRREGGKFAPREETIPAGAYSDDTQLTLAVARSLRAEDWWAHWTRTELPWWTQYQLGGGGATRRAAGAWAKGGPPWHGSDATRYWNAGGNGVAMRVLAHASTEQFELARDRVLADGAATHGHPIALVSAQAYAFALWLALRRPEPLGWGQLLDEVLGGVDVWAQLRPEAVPEEWSRHLPDDYEEEWGRTVERFMDLLTLARTELAHGALAVDDRVLEELGCFSPQSGAGTITVAGALYLASRHAADPRQGLLRAAFARGADTDTLAAMTGALLGAVHGPDWLGPVAEQVMDSALLRRTAELMIEPAMGQSEPFVRGAARHVETELARARPGAQLHLPFYGEVTVYEIRDLDNRTSRIRSWWMRNADGQTFRITRTSKAKRDPWVALTDAAAVNGSPPAPLRSGLVLRVRDLTQSRQFYESVLGMAVSRTTRSALVLGGWLALEPANDTQPKAKAPPPLAVTLYAEAPALAAAEARLTSAGVKYAITDTERGRALHTHDPDGIPVDICQL
jgi:ADP-ribosylglycohydrolase/catechol 2,3-dioxygenase-like lactoylglutathione lyase family enzyme